jgi:hypothetical protein
LHGELECIRGKHYRSFAGCKPKLHSAAVGDAPHRAHLNLADLTFATLFENGAQDTSLSCAGFSECGNSADPSIQTTLGGDHADNFMEVKFTGTIAGDADTSALVDMMQSEAKRLGISEEDWTKEKYNQDQQLLQMAQAKLGSVRVTSITFQSSM